jgi:ribosomal protein L44E
MLTTVFCAFLAYILYRLIFHFIIPVYRTTRQVKKSFKHMQEQMRQQQGGYQEQQQPTPQPSKKPAENTSGEYIDFEEIK